MVNIPFFHKKKAPVKEPVIHDEDTLPVVGQLAGKPFDLFSDDEFTSQEIDEHTPVQQLRAYTSDSKGTMTALNAADITEMKKNGTMPKLYANPMQGLDYRIYESLLKSTFIGALADAFIRYLYGQGIEPELELINPDDDPKKNQELIDKHQDIITLMKKIDGQIGVQMKGLDAGFDEKMQAMISSCLFYNRGALIKIYDKDNPLTIDGKAYPDIPKDYLFQHAQDLGLIEIDPASRRLLAVQCRDIAQTMTPVSDMIYMWNPVSSAKIYNSWHYGISIITPMISASKLIRQLQSDDFPAMSQATWARLYLIAFRPEGQTREAKIEEYKAIKKGLKPGSPAIIVKDPKDINTFDINFDPRISEFQALFESMIKLCISIMGLPQVGFYDESSANRDTMLGKIQLTMRTTIEPNRKWIGDAISQQHYMPIFNQIADDKVKKLFRIKTKWSDLHIAEWYDSIDSALLLDGRGQLKNTAFGDMISVENYEGKLDPDAEITPGGAQGNSMQMQDENGTMNISHTKSKSQQAKPAAKSPAQNKSNRNKAGR